MSKYIEVDRGESLLLRTGVRKLVVCKGTTRPGEGLVQGATGEYYFIAVPKGQQKPVLHQGDVLVLERLLYYNDGPHASDLLETTVHENTEYCYWLLITDEDE